MFIKFLLKISVWKAITDDVLTQYQYLDSRVVLGFGHKYELNSIPLFGSIVEGTM